MEPPQNTYRLALMFLILAAVALSTLGNVYAQEAPANPVEEYYRGAYWGCIQADIDNGAANGFILDATRFNLYVVHCMSVAQRGYDSSRHFQQLPGWQGVDALKPKPTPTPTPLPYYPRFSYRWEGS